MKNNHSHKLHTFLAFLVLFATFVAFSIQSASAAKGISVSGDLGFGDVIVGTTAQRSFVITNTGNNTLQISGISYPAGFSGNFVGPIHRGKSQTVVVTFAPTAVQAYGGTVTVNSDATSGPNTLPISGNGTGRAISLSGNLTYGGIPVGTTQIQTLTINNIGDSNLTVTSISYPEGFTGDFDGGIILPGDSTNVTVTFAPTQVKLYSGTVTVNSDAQSGTNTISAAGVGTGALISLSGDLNFGNVIVGSSAQLTLTITNNGNVPLNVTNIDLPAGFSGAFSGAIAANGTQNVTITFSPTDTLGYGGTVTVNSDAVSGANTVNASGTGIAATRIISLSGDLNFANVQVDSSAQLTLSITNSGNTDLTVSNIDYPTGFSGDFAGVLAPGASTDVTVTFSPTDAIVYGGTVTVNSDATSGVNTVNASGTGTAIPAPAIALSGDLNFGDVVVSNSAQLTFTITNTGTADLTVTNISYPAGFSGDFAGGTIASGETTNVTVTFSPTDTILYSGTITVDSDAQSGVNTVNASGTGVPGFVPTRIISLSGDLDFGNVTIGNTPQMTLTISNAGNSDLTISNIVYPAGFSGDFAGVIAAGATTNVTVTFSPVDTIAYGGTATVNSDATSGVNTFNVSGTGVEGLPPYTPRKARFNGLFSPSNNIAFDNSGYVAASTAVKGKIKLKIVLAGKPYSFRGVLSPDGQVSGSIARKGLSPLSIALEIHGDILSGTISDGVFTADLVANRNVFNKKSNVAPQAGTYTVTILGSGDASVAPTDNGMLTITVATSGVVKIAGTLGDGTKVTQSTTLSPDGEIPFFASLYSGGGSIGGWLDITNNLGHEVSGTVIWFKQPGVDPNYPNGFAFETTVDGAKN